MMTPNHHLPLTFGSNGGDESETSSELSIKTRRVKYHEDEEVKSDKTRNKRRFMTEEKDDQCSRMLAEEEEVVGSELVPYRLLWLDTEVRELFDDVHKLIDNEGIHNFVQPKAGERMRLRAMVTNRSNEECYAQGSERRKEKKGVVLRPRQLKAEKEKGCWLRQQKSGSHGDFVMG
ncbi:hypothetical protein Tco_1338153 [Tanacetum coccineum]